MSEADFRPRISKDQAEVLAERYEPSDDTPALKAGERIRSGGCSRDNLKVIFKWKTKDRGKSRLDKNSDQEIEEALQIATQAIQPRSAIAVLTGLTGVAVPVASAIMTAIHPDRYSIIDFRALETLDSDIDTHSLEDYLKYLDYCIGLARKWGIPLRTLDRALWQWSKENPPKAQVVSEA